MSSYVYAASQVACRVVLGTTILVASARTVELLAETVRRAVGYGPTNNKPVTISTDKSVSSYVDLTTAYSSVKQDWTSLGKSGLMNVAVGAAALFVANKFCPDLFTSATSFARNVVGI